MTRQEIQAFFPPSYSMHFGGLVYAVPTLAWLTGPAYAAFKAKYFQDDILAWTVKWECRDFARAFACFCQELNALTSGTPENADALAVGEFWFIPDGAPPGAGHAICPAITDQGLVFLDPQIIEPGKVRPTSPNEILRGSFLRW